MDDVTFDQILAAWRQRNTRLKELEENHKKKVAPLQAELDLLASALHKKLIDQGMQSFKSDKGYGTAYRQKWTKVKVNDWTKVLEWIKENKRDDLLVQQVNKTQALEALSTEPEGVPGLTVESGWKCLVRKS
jgi:phage host-nuclease inhibitor protein Gam